ncbi:MAG: ABC transporter substrate-binding protein [Plectolyngbya sp. WJT66-NPBG17]|jgi:NitT/TauT family transport system substrate-binding protein|nr:ABC transporter substrate-binding protein [Plectolyngbya sp. WJT66-NPBG17]MBW4528472.1 ABC transporter substrate-binding protein [Phormidium tanganyikae FI6-MK23]
MFKSRFVKLFAFALIALFWTVACSPSNNTATNSPAQTRSLTASTNPWSGYSGHHVTVKKDFYKQAGLTIEDILFQSNTEQITAFLSGKTDLAWMTAGDVIQMAGKDPNLKIIFLCDYSNGADGILGRGIKTAADLKGKTLAREDVLFQKVLLRAYLEKSGLTEKDIDIRDIPASDAATAFSAKRVDAAVTYEPFLTKAAKESGGEVIFSSKGTNLIADVLVTRPKLITERRADLIAFLKAADQGIKLLKSGDTDAIAAASSRLGIKPEELREQLTGITLFDIEGNKTIGFNPENPNNAIKSFELVAKAAYDFKVVPQPLDVKSLYDDSLVKSL